MIGADMKDKLTKEQINELIEENKALREVANDYTELKKFAEEVVDKYNKLVADYNSKQGEITKNKDSVKKEKEAKQKLEKELQAQKEISKNLEKKLLEFQAHINNLLEKYTELEKINESYKSTIETLENYIEKMEVKKEPIKNARNAGRKKKYKQSDIDYIIQNRLDGVEYEDIKEYLNKNTDKEWDIKEIKYVFARYKNMEE